MSMGTMTLLCLGWFVGQVPGDVFFTNQRNHRIPLDFQDARRGDIREMILYVSNDQGKTWQQRDMVAADKDHFTFAAPVDGEYWLQVAAVNRQGKQEPENISKTPAQQKMIVDTLKPLIRIVSARRQGDEIAVSWEIQEDHPDWGAFKLEYQVQPSLQWNPVQVQAASTGQTRIRPGSTNTVSVRLQLRDLAGNLSFEMAEVQGTPSVARESAAPTPAVVPASATSLVPPPVAAQAAAQTTAALPNPPPVSEEGTRESMKPMAPPTSVEKVAAAPPPPSWSGAPSGNGSRSDPNAKLVASSENPVPLPTPAPVPVPVPPPSRKPLPALQFVNSPEITLDYELSKVGPSGVGSVDLWWTQNDGQTWERYAFDPDAKGAGRHQRVVELPGDGVYGFLLVVKSRAGLGRKEPRPGDIPEIRIEVDTTTPVAQLFAPVPDPQRANSLVLSWAAKDNNLSTHPITLEWAERREGPWHPIAANLANTGRFSWQLPDQLPVQVHLRLRARDCAGNEGIAVTTEAQLVDLSEPEGRLLNVTVPPRR